MPLVTGNSYCQNLIVAIVLSNKQKCFSYLDYFLMIKLWLWAKQYFFHQQIIQIWSLYLLFMLMSENPSFNNANGPWWKLTIKVWSRIAKNDPEISYKLVKQLMAYYNDWKLILNIKQIFLLTIENQKVVHNLIRNPQCSLQITVAVIWSDIRFVVIDSYGSGSWLRYTPGT